MKGIYLSNLDPLQAKGYQSKILGQIQGFNQLGADMDLICFASNNRIVLTSYCSPKNSEIKEQTLSDFIDNLLIKRLSLYQNTLKIIKQNNPNFLYLRHPRSDPLYLNFLSKVKRLAPHLVIFSEIPTYPYDREYQNCQSIKQKILISLDKLTREKLKKYIDRIVVVAYEGLVFGIPSINITNGINVDRVKLKKYVEVNNNVIELIGVGNIDFWHGYDRIIYGLKEYDQNYDNRIIIIFNIVSPIKNEIKKLQAITMELGLSKYVIFHGEKDGEELNKLFDQCHVAVGTIGNHRINLQQLSPLKAREYTARGIPFINSYEDPDFSANFSYIFKITADDRPINIQQIIDFYKNIDLDSKYSIKIREYATQNLDWAIKLKPVIETVKSLANFK